MGLRHISGARTTTILIGAKYVSTSSISLCLLIAVTETILLEICWHEILVSNYVLTTMRISDERLQEDNSLSDIIHCGRRTCCARRRLASFNRPFVVSHPQSIAVYIAHSNGNSGSALDYQI